MKESTRRAIRTALQVAVGLFAVTPAVVAVLPIEASDTAWVLGIAAAATIVLTKVQNVLEEAGVVPTLLAAKDSDD